MELLKNLEASLMFWWFSDAFVFPRKSHKTACVCVLGSLKHLEVWSLLGSRCNRPIPADVPAAGFRLPLILQISLF